MTDIVPKEQIKKLSMDIEKIFTEENFPEEEPGYLDAARHFIAQGISTRDYGFFFTRAAGIYNEAVGTFRRGHKRNVTEADFKNNSLGRNFSYTEESKPYFKFIDEAIIDPESLTKERKDSLMNLVKKNAVYAPIGTIDDMSRSGRYNPSRIIKFLKDAY